jgi:DNA-binding CsgD family transcriptional regulator
MRLVCAALARNASSSAKTLDPIALAKQVAEEHHEDAGQTTAQAKPKKPRRKVVVPDTATAERAATTPSHEDDVIMFIDIERAVSQLSERQREVYSMTMDCATREEIAVELEVTPRRVGQLQAEIYMAMERALAVRLPGLTLPPLQLPDDGRSRKHMAMPDLLRVGIGDLADPGLQRLMLVDLLLAHHHKQARTPLVQTTAAMSDIKLDDSSWGEVGKVLACDSQVDWVNAARGMREHTERLGGALLLLRVQRVVKLLCDLFALAPQDNKAHSMQVR